MQGFDLIARNGIHRSQEKVTNSIFSANRSILGACGMVAPETLELIATSDDGSPMEEAMYQAEDRGDVVVIPIPQMGHAGIWIMTIALATIATPLVYFVMLRNSADHISGFMKVVPVAAWFLAVFGPICFYYFVPFGWLRPGHWLLFDRNTQVLSFQGGFHRWHRSQIQYLLAITGSRPKSERFVTELQICVGDAKYLILHTTQRDPEKAYGKTMRVFACAMQVPAYIAKMKADGAYDVIQIVDELKQSA